MAESVMVAVPAGAVDEIVNVATAQLPPTPSKLMLLKDRPVQLVERPTLQRLLPLILTLTVEPCGALDGEIEAMLGPKGGFTVTEAETDTHGELSVFLMAVKR